MSFFDLRNESVKVPFPARGGPLRRLAYLAYLRIFIFEEAFVTQRTEVFPEPFPDFTKRDSHPLGISVDIR